MPDSASITPFPLALSPSFLGRLGYRSARRFVAVSWEPAGDEAAYFDGLITVVGADPWAYAALVWPPRVAAWLRGHAIMLGNSDRAATHWLLVDRAADRGFVCRARAVRDIVRTQIVAPWPG